MLKNKKEKFFFTVVYICISIIVLYIIDHESQKRIDTHLESKTKDISQYYKVLFANYETLSNLIFDTKINKPEVLKLFKERKRKELQNYLQSDYNLVRGYNIRQLHFHTKENISFLRMHRPKKFGDDLTDIRATVKYVNETKKTISGFEEGRIFNGFRFVYPLFFEKEHIGSVEISFNALFFIEEILENYNVSANLLIAKNIVDKKVFDSEQSNYDNSSLGSYYFQKSILKTLKENFPDFAYDQFNEQEQNLIETKIDKSSPFSLYLDSNQNIITFIPLVNPITNKSVAALKVNSKDSFIKRHIITRTVLKIFIVILLALIVFFIYKIYFFQRDLKKQIKEKTKELHQLNDNLKETVAKEVEKNKEKEKLMITQSRHAAMGEMISMIAHQWRQPLTVISMAANNVLIDIELGIVSDEGLKKLSNEIIDQSEHLSKTIDDFRDFFKPGKKKEITKVNNVINESLNIVAKSFENNNIKLLKDFSSEIETNTFSRELLQVSLNILNNAKEALLEHTKTNRKIHIITYDTENFAVIEICDNAGGIPEEIHEQIFQPYFSTKEEKTGTGLGLYMSKMIIEKHMKGVLEFENRNEGVCFVIKIPLGE